MNDLEKQAHNYRIWALVIEQQVIAEGMKAENAQRQHLGHSMAYVEDEFVKVANNIAGLANNFAY